MERSDFLIKLVSVLVLLALVFYIGVSAYTNRTDPLRTVLVSEMSLEDLTETVGYAVREEEQVSASGGVTPTVSNGEKVSAGETIATSHNNDAALREAEEMQSLSLRAEQLRTLLSGGQSAKDSVLLLSTVLASGDLSGLESAAMALRDAAMVAGGTDSSSIRQELEDVEEQLRQLKSHKSSGGITAPHAGLFTSTVDGFESISPDDLGVSITPAELNELFSDPYVGSGTFGKIVTGIRWYYVTTLSTSDAAKLADMRQIEVEFYRTYTATVTMTVERIGPVSDGQCVAVLSSTRYVREVAGLRELTARLIFSSEEGLRVPREAVHLDDKGNAYVYVLEGVQASKVTVTLLGEDETSYMVERTSSGLQEDDEVITRAASLHDGAVVIE